MTLEYYEVKRDLILAAMTAKGNEWATEVVEQNGETYKSRKIKEQMDELDLQLTGCNTMIANLRAE